MEIRKVVQSLITFWILFLTVTAFPSYSNAAKVSSDTHNTIIEQSGSWSASLAKSQISGHEVNPELSHPQRRTNYTIAEYRYCHIKNGINTTPLSFPFSLTLCNCQLLI